MMQRSALMRMPAGMAGVASTVSGGLETPDHLELRKNTGRVEESSGPRSLYQVVPERQTSIRGLMGSERGYDVAAVAGANAAVLGEECGTIRKANGVDVSIDESELAGLSEDQLRRSSDSASRGNAGVAGRGRRED